jgi:hypothetical protein
VAATWRKLVTCAPTKKSAKLTLAPIRIPMGMKNMLATLCSCRDDKHAAGHCKEQAKTRQIPTEAADVMQVLTGHTSKGQKGRQAAHPPGQL